jgi:argininosuccinate lyase
MIRKGRFKEPAADIAQRYGESISSDWRLYPYDIAGSPLLDSDVANIFDVRGALAKRHTTGAPSPKNVAGADQALALESGTHR